MRWWGDDLPSEAPPLKAGALHLWLLDLSRAQAHYASNLAHLSAQERARAARYISDRPRHQFAQARAHMRQILGRYIGLPAKDLRLDIEHRGKPRLATTPQPLRFNLSHSHDAAALVVGLNGALGVDVEHHDTRRGLRALARYAFSESEQRALETSGDYVQTFFRTWTLKEAYLKAMGQGLAIDLKSFEVDASASDAARLVRAAHPLAQPERWWMHALELSAHYSVAIAYDYSQPASLEVMRFTNGE